MSKIEGDYMIITEPREAVLFLGQSIQYLWDENWIQSDEDWGIFEDDFAFTDSRCFDGSGYSTETIRVTREQVKTAIEPNDGSFNMRPAFSWSGHKDHESPTYMGSQVHVFAKVAANALTIGKTCGELRQLWAWCEGGE